MNAPFITVLIVGRNVGHYIAETVESALAQTWQEREVIVVDDGSTDETATVLSSFGDRIRLLTRPPLGLAAGRNAGMAAAKGNYIALLDADDLWHPTKLQVQLAVAARHPGSGLIISDGVEFGPEGELRPHLLQTPFRQLLETAGGREYTGGCHELFIHVPPVSCPAQTLIPRPVMERLGPFADLNSQDYEYYLRIAREYPVTIHADSLTRWRNRPDGLSGPRETRAIVWPLDDQPVLKRHARGCDRVTQAMILRRRRFLAQAVGVRALALADSGDRPRALRALRRLLRLGPWPPIALLYLAALYAPGGVRRAGGTVWRRIVRGE